MVWVFLGLLNVKNISLLKILSGLVSPFLWRFWDFVAIFTPSAPTALLQRIKNVLSLDRHNQKPKRSILKPLCVLVTHFEIYSSQLQHFFLQAQLWVPLSSTPPSVQHISSTQKGHSFSAPKIPQFHTKNPSVPHPSVQHQKSLSSTPFSSTPKTPQFHTKKSSI